MVPEPRTRWGVTQPRFVSGRLNWTNPAYGFSPGDKLGPYEIVALIGKGGMPRGTAARTRLSAAPSPTKSRRANSATALSAKPGRFPHSIIPPFARSMTSATRTEPTSW